MFCDPGRRGWRALPPAGGLRHPGPGPHQPDRGRGGDGDRQLALLQECPEAAWQPEPVRGERDGCVETSGEDTELPGAKKKCEACWTWSATWEITKGPEVIRSMPWRETKTKSGAEVLQRSRYLQVMYFLTPHVCCTQVLVVSLRGVTDHTEIPVLTRPLAGDHHQLLPEAFRMTGGGLIFTLNLNFSQNSLMLARTGPP